MTEADFLRTTRTSYDAIAVDYAERFRDELAGMPLERAVLGAFAETVREAGGGPVADVGCGPGEVTAYLDGLGLPVFGIDLSPGMLALARREHPGLRFEEGSMLALDQPDGSLGAVVAWYSTIHVPAERLPEVFAEFHRVLVPGGRLLVAFQVGDEPRCFTEAFGHPVDLTFRRWRPDRIAELLDAAGLPVHARTVRGPERWESTPQAVLIARKPGGEDTPSGL
ncbi:class I SAM-dependent DNA methyltransferase [Streptomyces cucumeris]|uniref:class I SAM-dependent DNA methyltransferase n=1 Tax=Streptomyces cucumeris TaxID=2962890 RepID=UPI003D705D23